MKRLSLTAFCHSFFIFFSLVSATLFSPLTSQADEISFGETYVERLTVPDSELVWSGTSSFEIILPWNGFDIEQITGNTEINISIGELQFVQILDGSEDYEEGARSATFRTKDFDNDGNEVDVQFVDVSWNTQTFSISGTFRNFSNAGQADFIGALNHAGVAGAFQETILADVAFGAASTSQPLAVSGSTTLTRRVVDDEPIDLSNVQLSGSATLPPNDTTKPTVSIMSPASNGRLLTPVITGKATDNTAVAEVLYRIGEDAFAPVAGTTNWSIDLPLLLPGTNVVEVKSIDRAGNESPVLRRTFFYVVTSPLTVELNPGWGSTTLTNGQLLELARSYSITAKPAPGYLFQDWSGSINSQSATISFVMEPDFLLQPNFVPNPFLPIKGIYNGLFSDANGVAPASAGFFTATIKDSGAFSGRILLSGASHFFTGLFATDGRADKIILRPGKPSLNVHLQMGFDGTLSGTLTQNSVVSDLFAELAQTTTNSANIKYTLLIPPAIDPATAPGGYGFGATVVDRKSRLRFIGTLSDGTFIHQTTAVSTFNRWPLFASLYRGKGVLSGWMSFTNEPDSDLRGDLTWVKLPGALGRFYANGFTLAGSAIGSLYVPPALGTNVLNSTNPTSGTLELSGGNLSVPLTNTFLLNTNNRVTITSPNKTILSVVRPSGLFRGTFVHPATGRNALIKGAILQKPMWGGGFFLGTNLSGSFLLQPEPIVP